jgi:hypothetical protein
MRQKHVTPGGGQRNISTRYAATQANESELSAHVSDGDEEVELENPERA